MIIKKMTATFGKLNQAVLTPAPGLTVITAPNEGGKSTWTAFLKAMLFGLDTRERDRSGFLADKNHYQPWSGAPMSGELELEWQGRGILLRRFSTKAGPFQGFEAVYTASGDPVPGLTAANAGPMLTGMVREVFVRSALIAQNSTAVSSAPELEQRIAALATSGQEDVSFSATQRTLKDWRNRRQANRSTGLIPELNRQLDQVQASLRAMEQARLLRDQATEHLGRLRVEEQELTGQLEVHRRLAQKDLNRRYAQAVESLARARAQRDALPEPDGEFAGLTAQQARERARNQAPEREDARDQTAAQTGLLRRRKGLLRATAVLVPLLGFGGLAGVIAGFLTRIIPVLALGFAGMFLAVGLSLLFVSRIGQIDRTLARLSRAEQANRDGDAGAALSQRAEAYADWLTLRDRLEDEVRHCRERAEDLKSQGGREADTLEHLAPPPYSLPETQQRLERCRLETARWQTQLDQAIGALRTDPLDLEAQRDQLLDQLEVRTQEASALDQALDALEHANGILRERFSPPLNETAARLFAELTGSAYRRLSLNRDFTASAARTGDSLPHDALYLSSGTADQLYLAVRLALCQLTAPDVPVVLDDVLASFDDTRAQLALDCLARLSQDRQILLFTCHSREAQWARTHQAAVCTL